MDAYEKTKIAFKACFEGDLSTLERIINELAIRPDFLFFNYAIVKGQMNVIKYLVEKQNMIPDKDIFIESVKRSHFEVVQYLNRYHKFDYDCLKCALENKCWSMVDILLQSGLNIMENCISFIIYGERIKEYIDYRKGLETQNEECKNVSEGQEPY